MRIRLGVPTDANRDEKEAILNAALESVTRANEAGLKRGLPSFESALRAGKVRWRPEPPGDEHFDLGKTVLKRGWGDCDDLAPWHAASLRLSGEDPEAFAYVRPSGPNRWHAVVGRSDGTTDDPSRWAGMGSVGGDEYVGPFWPSMFGDRLSLASYPLYQGYAGRVDVPSTSAPGVYSALVQGRNPRLAIAGACGGALDICGDDAYYDDQLRLAALHDLLTGQDPRSILANVANVAGEETVGFFAALAPAAASLAAPLAGKALSAMGVNLGSKPAAQQAASSAYGPPPGSALHCPGGPIIVRF